MAIYRSIRGLQRGLKVLEILSAGSQERLQIVEIAQRTGLHRTTVKRLLETLAGAGYVWRSASDNSFRLTHRVRSLSLGCSDAEVLSELAAPYLGKLRRAAVWPIDLTINDGDAMYVRETTHSDSPLSFVKENVNRRLPMLVSASGRAFLAFCAPARRDQILVSLRKEGGFHGALARSPRASAILSQTRRAGFGVNDRKWAPDPKFRALAVPIRFNGDVLGCLGLLYVGKAMTIAEAKSRYLEIMLTATAQIERELDAVLAPKAVP